MNSYLCSHPNPPCEIGYSLIWKSQEMSEGDALEPSRLLCLVAYLEPQMRGCLGQRSTSVSNSGSTAIYSLLVIGLLLIRRRGHLDLLAVSSQKLV